MFFFLRDKKSSHFLLVRQFTHSQLWYLCAPCSHMQALITVHWMEGNRWIIPEAAVTDYEAAKWCWHVCCSPLCSVCDKDKCFSVAVQGLLWATDWGRQSSVTAALSAITGKWTERKLNLGECTYFFFCSAAPVNNKTYSRWGVGSLWLVEWIVHCYFPAVCHMLLDHNLSSIVFGTGVLPKRRGDPIWIQKKAKKTTPKPDFFHPQGQPSSKIEEQTNVDLTYFHKHSSKQNNK